MYFLTHNHYYGHLKDIALGIVSDPNYQKVFDDNSLKEMMDKIRSGEDQGTNLKELLEDLRDDYSKAMNIQKRIVFDTLEVYNKEGVNQRQRNILDNVLNHKLKASKTGMQIIFKTIRKIEVFYENLEKNNTPQI